MKSKSEMLKYCSNWYQTLSGKAALERVDDICTDIMSEIFGYYAIQIGALSGKHDLLRSSRIAADFSIVSDKSVLELQDPQPQKNKKLKTSLISSIEQLPVATDNIDLVVASHVLELSEDPHQVLREIDRVLVPEGHCVLIGFNPFSVSRLARLIRSGFTRKNNLYMMRSVPRVRDWFSLLGFEVLDVHYMGMRLGTNNKKLFERLRWLERWGGLAAPFLGNMYLFHVKKQVVAMRPHKPIWEAPAVLIGGKVVLNRTAQKIRRQNYSN